MATLVERECVDNDLQKIKWDGGNGTKYISFQNSTSDTRLGALHVNSMNNMEVKYEYITNVDLLEEVEYQGKRMKFKEMILIIKVGGKKNIFGYRKRSGLI